MKIRKSPQIGESGYERMPHDAYQTIEPWLPAAVLSRIRFRGRVWEPACGQGYLCRALASHGYDVHASDIQDLGWGHEVRDFFTFREPPAGVRTIFTNGPFGDLGLAFARHALDLMAPIGGMVCLLLPHYWIAAGDRMDLFDERAPIPFDRQMIIPRRPKWFHPQPGRKKAPNPRIPFAWYLWRPEAAGRLGFVEVVPA